jgi:hypothetical protein
MTMDIKETKDILVGVNEIGVFLVKEIKLKKPVAMIASDFVDALLSNPEFKQKLVDMYENAGMVGDELADISLMEGLSLAKVQVSYVPAYIAALKG